MHTTLIHIGPLAIRSYGLMLALSFLCGVLLAYRRTRTIGLDFQRLIDLTVYVIVASIVGSRALYVVFHLQEFSAHPLDVINPFQSSGEIGIQGLSMYGGVILSLIVGLWFFRRHRLPTWKMTDAIAPSLAFGTFLTRIGCFLNGCCFGKPGDLPWCVVFPSDSAAGYFFPGTAVHPTQLYASLGGILIFGVLLFLERRKPFAGAIFWTYIALDAVVRFAIDFLRYYEDSSVLSIGHHPFSVSQLITAGLFALAVFMLYRLKQRRSAVC